MTTASQAVPVQPKAIPVAAKKIRSNPILKVLTYGLLLFLSFTWLFPLYWMISTALKDEPQVYTIPPVWLPDPMFWNNFVDGWARYDFNTAAINSVFRYSLPVTVLT